MANKFKKPKYMVRIYGILSAFIGISEGLKLDDFPLPKLCALRDSISSNMLLTTFLVIIFIIIVTIYFLLKFYYINFITTEHMLEFRIMLQEPHIIPQDQQPNVLDLVTRVFTVSGILSAGWIFNSTLSNVSKGELIFDCERGEQCNCVKKLKVVFDSDKELENFYMKTVPYAKKKGIIKAKNNELKAFRNSIKNEFDCTIMTMGHAESEYTYRMGAIYTSQGITQIAPYATSQDLIKEVTNILQKWNKDTNPMLLCLPPDNRAQAELIVSTINQLLEMYKFKKLLNDKIYKSVVVLDTNNLEYSESIKEHIVKKLNWDKKEKDSTSFHTECYKRENVELYIIWSDIDQIAIDYERFVDSNLLLLVGMANFTSSIMERLTKYSNNGNKSSPQVIVVTDGVVNGDRTLRGHPNFDSRRWKTTDCTRALLFTVPERGQFKGLDYINDALNCFLVKNDEYKNNKFYKIQNIESRFSDPDFRFYVWMGAYWGADIWHYIPEDTKDAAKARKLVKSKLFEPHCPNNSKNKIPGFPFEVIDLKYANPHSFGSRFQYELLHLVFEGIRGWQWKKFNFPLLEPETESEKS